MPKIGYKQTKEHKKKHRESKLGDKNPTKRPEVREKYLKLLLVEKIQKKLKIKN